MAVVQSVQFACGLKATEFVFVYIYIYKYRCTNPYLLYREEIVQTGNWRRHSLRFRNSLPDNGVYRRPTGK
jgi:hypothetical protein